MKCREERNLDVNKKGNIKKIKDNTNSIIRGWIAIGISIIAIIFAGFSWWSTKSHVDLYRKDLTLKYFPTIYPTIGNTPNHNEPVIIVTNSGQGPTEIVDYKIEFWDKKRDPESGKYIKTRRMIIKKEYLDKDLIGQKISVNKPGIFFFKNTNGFHPVLDLLSTDKDIIYCKGYIKVKNLMDDKDIKKYDFRCERGSNHRDPNKIFWFDTQNIR